MDKDYTLSPLWYELSCLFSSFVPFAGGAVTKYVINSSTPEEYVYGYLRPVNLPTFTFTALSTLTFMSYLIDYSTAPVKDTALVGLINAGYLFNSYQLFSSTTDEIEYITTNDPVGDSRRKDYDPYFLKGLSYIFSSSIPFVGGIVTKCMVNYSSAEEYVHGYLDAVLVPTLGFTIITSGCTLRACFDMLYFKDYSTKLLGLLSFINAGYLYNLYELGASTTDEIEYINIHDPVQIDLMGVSMFLEQMLKAIF